MSQSQENLQTDRRTNRSTDGRTDRLTDPILQGPSSQGWGSKKCDNSRLKNG